VAVFSGGSTGGKRSRKTALWAGPSPFPLTEYLSTSTADGLQTVGGFCVPN
jgi:hypothetical protein